MDEYAKSGFKLKENDRVDSNSYWLQSGHLGQYHGHLNVKL